MGEFGAPNRRFLSRCVIAAIGIAVLGSAATIGLLLARDDGAVPTAAVERAATAAITGEYAALRAPTADGLTAMYTGHELANEASLQSHIHGLMAAGADYPGDMQLSDVQFLGVTGDSSDATVDLQAHAKLPNMRDGQVIDYSEADMIYHVALALTDGTWKATDVEFTFTPGSGP